MAYLALGCYSDALTPFLDETILDATRAGHRGAILSLVQRATIYDRVGLESAAWRSLEQANSRSLVFLPFRPHVLACEARLHANAGKTGLAAAAWQEARDLGLHEMLLVVDAKHQLVDGEILSRRGAIMEAKRVASDLVARLRQAGARFCSPSALELLATIEGQLGDLDAARAALQAAQAIAGSMPAPGLLLSVAARPGAVQEAMGERERAKDWRDRCAGLVASMKANISDPVSLAWRGSLTRLTARWLPGSPPASDWPEATGRPRRQRACGARAVWMQGVVNEAAAAEGREAGLLIIMDRRLRATHRRLAI